MERPVPESIISLRAEISHRVSDALDPKWQESDLIIECSHLRHKLKQNVLSDEEAINAILTLDAKFEAFSQKMLPSWQYKTVRVDERSNHHFELYHHIYADESMAQMWNVLRLTRILLHDLILSTGLLDEPSTISRPAALALHLQSTAVVKQMASEICASVPQFIGILSRSAEATPSSKSSPQPVLSKEHSRITATRLAEPSHHLPCYRLIFPLYVAAQGPAAPALLKPWAIKQLDFIAEYQAIENAAAVARMLESDEKRNPWHVYAMLGSYAFVC
jgi:hypothetical protein